MSRKDLSVAVILLGICFLPPVMVHADGSGDSSAQSLLKEMKNRYQDQNRPTVSPTPPTSPSIGLPPPPSSPTIPPMSGASGSSSANAPIPPPSPTTIPDQSHTVSSNENLKE